MQLLDLRSFSSIWYWLMLTWLWTRSGRNLLGVPVEVVQRAHRAAQATGPGGADHGTPAAEQQGHPGLLLLDWLLLTLPRWHLPSQSGAVLLGTGAFLLTLLAGLGFGYAQELAQAVFLLVAPFGVLMLMRVRLARRLAPLLAQAQARTLAPTVVARDSARLLMRHRWQVLALSTASVAAAAIWGTAWVIRHPFGL